MRVKLLHAKAKLPAYAKPGDAGADLCAVDQVWIPPGATVLVPIGIALELPWDRFATIRPRSSLTKRGILGGLGTIDSGYRGEIQVALTNTLTGEADWFEVSAGDRVGQLVIEKRIQETFTEAETLSETERGAGGFGSTGR